MRTAPTVLLAATLVGALIAGCGDQETPRPDPGAIEADFLAFVSAFNGRDFDRAYSFLSRACQELLDREEYVATLTAGAEQAGEDFRVEVSDLRVEDRSSSQAHITYILTAHSADGPEVSQQEDDLVFEEGRWRIDNC